MRSLGVFVRVRRKQEITQTGRPINQKGIVEEKKEDEGTCRMRRAVRLRLTTHDERMASTKESRGYEDWLQLL